MWGGCACVCRGHAATGAEFQPLRVKHPGLETCRRGQRGSWEKGTGQEAKGGSWGWTTQDRRLRGLCARGAATCAYGLDTWHPLSSQRRRRRHRETSRVAELIQASECARAAATNATAGWLLTALGLPSARPRCRQGRLRLSLVALPGRGWRPPAGCSRDLLWVCGGRRHSLGSLFSEHHLLRPLLTLGIFLRDPVPNYSHPGGDRV